MKSSQKSLAGADLQGFLVEHVMKLSNSLKLSETAVVFKTVNIPGKLMGKTEQSQDSGPGIWGEMGLAFTDMAGS